MAPSADDNDAAAALPDFPSFREKYGWPVSDAMGYQIAERPCGTQRPLRVIAVGGGVSGINLAKILPEQVEDIDLIIYERTLSLVGRGMRIGVRCDIPSHNYQFTWARNPEWKEFYSTGAEIQKYILKVVDRFDLRKYFLTSRQVVGATWVEDSGVWDVQVKDLTSGTVFTKSAEIFVNNDGLLNNWRWPKIEGLHDFRGTLCHTANYDPSTVLDGKRVAVIGIGSTGLQVVPDIQPRVKQLFTFVRSPTWVTPGFAQKYSGPGGTNFVYTEEQKAEFRKNPAKYQEYVKGIENEFNVRFRYILQGTPEASEAKRFSVESMNTKLGGRTELEEAIIPQKFGLGCRRPTPGTGFLEALTQPNVTPFTKPLTKVTEKGFLDPDGNEREVDVIICATGFDTSWVPRFPIWVNGFNLQDARKKELLSYLSLATPDVPNYFGICGPYGPFAHGSWMTVSELLTRNIIKVIKKIQNEWIKSVTPKREVCQAFKQHADLFAQRTAWVGPCSSWFKNGDPNANPSVFPGSRLVYWQLLTEPRWEDCHIQYCGGNEFNFMGNGFHLLEYTGGDNSYYLGGLHDPILFIPEERV